MNQNTIDRAVNIATQLAINGTPAERIIWIHPHTGSDDTGGVFTIQYAKPHSPSMTLVWKR